MARGTIKIDTKVWAQLRKRLPEKSVVKVGVLAAQGGNATIAGSNITMIELAAIHEFGSPKNGIPQRSFIRSTFERPEIAAGLQRMGAKFAKAIVEDKMTGAQALGLIGAWGVAQIKKTIKDRQTTGPDAQENKPETIARKGSSLPLVDNSRLINAITWLVQMGK